VRHNGYGTYGLHGKSAQKRRYKCYGQLRLLGSDHDNAVENVRSNAMDIAVIILILLSLPVITAVTFFLVIVTLLWLANIEKEIMGFARTFDDLGVKRGK